ncbi:ribosomal protection-like ABC-F family protein [Vallitalea sp.]|uniref:ribosomal protection-like ABC-F family protein n=1 Tax=Vallitalea sp. TaxID=1882829 RepID=UPI0025D8485F|nr:ABC-F family ATP-binding cassette domain-containing protein [Vallitalea sp.]MCT4688123.1 ATP-binding cassette domain-containing protein [Vallitalea sp.]
MIELGINNLSKSFGANKIFENVSFDIKTGEIVGLIGGNGTGKTTIMKILMGHEDYEGEVFYRKGVTLGYLDQIPVFEEDYSVKEVLYLAFSDVYDIKKKMIKIEHSLTNEGNDIDKLMKEYGQLQERFELLGGYDIDEKMSKVTIGLRISDSIQKMKFANLSGGEKSKIMLGKILLEKPELLLLDEPSNHLDLKSIEWLEEYLKEYKGSVLIISHDRYFLDRVVNKIVELEYNGTSIYHGNYTYYLMEKERRFIEAYNRYKQNQKKINKMEEQIKRYRIWGKMRDSDKMYVRAKELEKRLAKMEKLDKPVLEKTKIKLSSKGFDRTGKEVLILKEIEKSFESRILFSGLNLTLFYQDSLAILGDNGTGKSTLIKIVMEDFEKDKGSIKYGSNINIGYLPQEVKFEDENTSILEAFQYKYNITIGEARKELAKVLFIKDEVYKKISILSGGEKSRLKLCMLMYEKVNFMILDEPTNHLDIDSREILEETLLDFKGTILFVSHDRYFINKIATKIGEIENERLEFYNGDYEYYKNELLKKADSIILKRGQVNRSSNKNYNRKRENDNEKIIKRKKKLLESIEIEIESIELSIDELDKEMLENSTDVGKLNEISIKQNNKKEVLSKLLEEWESISEEIIL